MLVEDFDTEGSEETVEYYSTTVSSCRFKPRLLTCIAIYCTLYKAVVSRAKKVVAMNLMLYAFAMGEQPCDSSLRAQPWR